MKTKLALTILGAYNALMGVLMLAMPGTMGEALVGAEKAAASPEMLEMGTMFHYGLAPALLMIGLLLIFARSSAIETAKQLLLAYVISTGVLLGVFFGVLPTKTPSNSVQKWQRPTWSLLPWRCLLTSKGSDEALYSTHLPCRGRFGHAVYRLRCPR